MDAQYEALMVKMTDGTATPAEREALMTWLADKPELARELEQHQALKAVTDGWMSRLELDLAEDQHRKQGLSRIEAGLGMTLVVGGLGLLIGFVMFQAILDPAAPLAIKIGFSALLGGGAILLAAAIRWRLKTRNKDAYREVIR